MVGVTTRSMGGSRLDGAACMFRYWFRKMEATLDPSSSISFWEVEAYLDPPLPILASGKGRLT